jgi:hypothetical protein
MSIKNEKRKKYMSMYDIKINKVNCSVLKSALGISML